MTWNYRVVMWDEDDADQDFMLEIREVFYDVDGVPYAHGMATAMSENIEGLHEVLDMMRLAFTKDVLHYPEDFVGDVNKENPIH